LRNSSFLFERTCNTTNEELLINLMNTQMDVNQINAFVSTTDLPDDTLDAYLGTTCGENKECGSGILGKGLAQYETSYNEKVTIWMVCLGNPVLNTTITIQGAYLRDWTESEYDDDDDDDEDDDDDDELSKGGIAGIVIGSIVGFFIIVGAIICCKCNKNKTTSLPGESPREIERKDTELAGSNDIAH
jgi:hypothetical protein